GAGIPVRAAIIGCTGTYTDDGSADTPHICRPLRCIARAAHRQSCARRHTKRGYRAPPAHSGRVAVPRSVGASGPRQYLDTDLRAHRRCKRSRPVLRVCAARATAFKRAVQAVAAVRRWNGDLYRAAHVLRAIAKRNCLPPTAAKKSIVATSTIVAPLALAK